jgi:hypothetical protein
MKDMRKLPREQLDKIDKMLHSMKDELSIIPHIVLAASIVEGEENVGWMHSQVMASGSELTMMFVQLIKSNRDIKRAIEGALEYVKQEDSTGDIKSMINNAIRNVIKKVAETDEEFLKSLEEDMNSKSGSDFDVEGLLNEVLGKRDKDNKEDNDQEGDKQK